ncbi:capsular biosynthesis protein [Halobacillus locisalis]|uniref:Capsular biosynthesis protein n=1 Tax=Halobacillus locisalis TaxID=220753 RepID=A0A838CU66_9BACI|nr:Wzz/FepE/Etk N-terminal domain-containing protein [Halobacillus locisalis]MBA2175349.1 capsular biosynthesis protein [Halobacillus locisalis]
MEETISLKEIFEVLKKRILMILGIAVGAAIISGLITFFVLTPTYQSSTQFIVNQSPEQQQTAAYDINDIRTNVELINTYNVIIKSPAILDRVTEELSLEKSAGSLASQIQVSNANQSQVVDVTVTDPDPALAVEIANTTVETFQEEIPTLMNVDNVNILSPAVATADPSPVSPKPMLNIAIAIVVGLMAGVGLAFLLEYLDNSIKSEQDIEQVLGMPVMGVVSTISQEEVDKALMNAKKPRPVEVRRESIGS